MFGGPPVPIARWKPFDALVFLLKAVEGDPPFSGRWLLLFMHNYSRGNRPGGVRAERRRKGGAPLMQKVLL